MEKVDIVDENLKVLCAVSKEEAHAKGLLHPTIVAEIINSKSEWLLVSWSICVSSWWTHQVGRVGN